MKQDIIVFGSGRYFEKKRETINAKFNIICFLDNSIKPRSIGEKYGVKIYNPNDIEAYKGNVQILLTSAIWFEMWKQLIELGIDEKRIAFGSELYPFSDSIEEILYARELKLLSKEGKLYLVGRNQEYCFSEEEEFNAIVRKLFYEEFPYIEVISKMPLNPISRRFGLERGKAIDRFYIEKFLKEKSKYIHGTVMEIGDDRYTKLYGNNVEQSIVLHVNGWGG